MYNNRQLAKNSIILYVRMALLMFVTLYTSRVLLKTLGVDDYGIYNVVGGFVAMLGFFTSSLSNATQRYLNIGLGRKDESYTKTVFSQSFTLLFLISLAVLLIGETIGLWFVQTQLIIPSDRETAAFWVYQFSLLSVVCSINEVTFIGAIVAHEKMDIYAYLGLFEAAARLLIIYLILLANVDRLILYGGLMALISIICAITYYGYSRQFQETSLKFSWDKSFMKDYSVFVGYNFFGCFAYSAGMQGTNIVMNMFFGPVVNASRGIALQVSSVAIRFTESLMTAMKPQIIQSYTQDNKERTLLLIEKGSKYSMLLALMISVPILFEIDYILNLWLIEPPMYASRFASLAIVESIFMSLINPLLVATNATGDIKNTQVFGRLITMSSVVISFIVLTIIKQPMIPMYILVFTQIGYWLYCLLDVHRQIDLDIKQYFRYVCQPCIIYFLLLAVVGSSMRWCFPNAYIEDFLLVEGIIIPFEILLIFVVLDQRERSFVLDVICAKLKMKK